MTTQVREPARRAPHPTPPPPPRPAATPTLTGTFAKLALLGLTGGIAVWAAFPLV